MEWGGYLASDCVTVLLNQAFLVHEVKANTHVTYGLAGVLTAESFSPIERISIFRNWITES